MLTRRRRASCSTATSSILDVAGVEVGIVGTKGFVGGFPGSSLPDFGEPLLRQVYAETTDEVAAIERGLQEVSRCALRIVLLHYAPTDETLEGEPRRHPHVPRLRPARRRRSPSTSPTSSCTATPTRARFEGRIGETPVYNVAVHVTGRDFWSSTSRCVARGEIEVEARA